MRLPSVIALKDYIPSARRPAFTRFNVFLRDGFQLPVLRRADGRRTDLTFDHVIPRSPRRPHHLAERRHRLRRVQSAQGLPPAARMRACSRASSPRQPTTWELQDNGRAFPPNYLHQSWRDYLYWDSELES